MTPTDKPEESRNVGDHDDATERDNRNDVNGDEPRSSDFWSADQPRERDTRHETASGERRTLRFETIDDLRAEIDRIIDAESAGTLRTTGNWTVGQTFGHLAAWIEYSYSGYPFAVPWFIRLIVRMMKKRFLTKPMSPGVRLPRAKGGTYATEPMSTEDGARRLRHALDRLERREPAPFDSPALGKLTDEERIQLHLRHAELHLGFLHPE
jgi:hypothetical protein